MRNSVKYIKTKTLILSAIDLFYPLFRPFIDRQTFRYMAVGGSNMLVDIFMYFIAYNFIIDKHDVHLTHWMTISPHIAAFLFAFCISFPLGFIMMRTLVFPNSILKGKTQLFRYFSVALLNIFLNYVLLKLFVEQFHFYPTPSKMITTLIIVVISYLLQRFFTFKS